MKNCDHTIRPGLSSLFLYATAQSMKIASTLAAIINNNNESG